MVYNDRSGGGLSSSFHFSKLEWNSYERTVFPAPAVQLVRPKDQVSMSEKISRIPQHHKVPNGSSRQPLNFSDSSTHCPVPSCRLSKISLWINLKLRGDSQFVISRRSGSNKYKTKSWAVAIFVPVSALKLVMLSPAILLNTLLLAMTVFASWKTDCSVLVAPRPLSQSNMSGAPSWCSP